MFKATLTVCSLLTAVAAKQCVNITIPVDVSARNGIFDVQVPHSNLDVTQFALNLTNARGNFTDLSLLGYAAVTGEAFISAKFCAPDTMPTQPVVQLLTHGIGFDKTYWDLPYGGFKYSYVNTAVDLYGFCTLAIDRFGIGNSTVADPLSIVQAPVTMSTIYHITRMLRDGTVPEIAYPFSKVVHVGHSFGAALTYELVSMYPDVSDGIILTGFSTNGNWVGATIAGLNLQLANLNEPMRFGQASTGLTSQPNMENLPDGYITWANIQTNEFAFFSPQDCELTLLEYTEAHKMPATVGEFLTLGSVPAAAPEFRGPVLVITGNKDTIYCGGDCIADATPDRPSVLAALQPSFPVAEAFEAYVQPNMGHAMNMHLNTTGLYRVMLDFLDEHGLGVL